MKLALVAKKGGVGKSTLSLFITEALVQVGRRAAIQDWDEQGTSSKSSRAIGRELAVPGQQYDYLIYDTKPDLTDISTRNAIEGADVILVVTTPSTADMWEAKEAVDLARMLNPKAAIRLVFNRVQKGTILTRHAEDSTQILGIDIPALKTQVPEKQSFKHFIGGGWEVLDSASQQIVANLTVEVVTLTPVQSTAVY